MKCLLCNLDLDPDTLECNTLVEDVVSNDRMVTHYFVRTDHFGSQEVCIINNHLIANVISPSGFKYCNVHYAGKIIMDIDTHIDIRQLVGLNEQELTSKFRTYQLFS